MKSNILSQKPQTCVLKKRVENETLCTTRVDMIFLSQGGALGRKRKMEQTTKRGSRDCGKKGNIQTKAEWKPFQ